jgi:glycosyltransferase involved in cell wall biosynthesis
MNLSPKRPRILVVTPFWPHRSGIGSEVRAGLTINALRDHAQVEVAVLDDGELTGDAIRESLESSNPPRVVPIVSRPRPGIVGKLRWMLDPELAHPFGCGATDAAATSLSAQLADYDLVWFFKIRSPLMFPTMSWKRSVLDIDDVPSTYERAAMSGDLKLGQRVAGLTRWWSWRRRERRLGRHFRVLSVCSSGDRDYLRQLGVEAPIHVIPNGVARPAPEPERKPAHPPRIGFIGLFDYAPNHLGIEWFARKCWPLIKSRIPDARLRLVGRGSDGSRKPAGPDIDSLGWLADPAAELATWSASVVPIQFGAGTRVKIAQGFAQKTPLVSTRLGAYGYDVADGRELLLADSPNDFADACVHLIQQPNEASEMAERAWRRFIEEWSSEAIKPRVWNAAEECLRLGN